MDFMTCGNENCKLKETCVRFQFKEEKAEALAFIEPILCEFYCPENAKSLEAFSNSLGLLCYDFNVSFKSESFGREKFKPENFEKLRDSLVK